MITEAQFFEQWWASKEGTYRQMFSHLGGSTNSALQSYKATIRAGINPIYQSEYLPLWAATDARQRSEAQARELARQAAEQERKMREEAARVAAEQARIQAELQAEQQRIAAQQAAEARAVEAQLAAQRQAVQQEQANIQSQFASQRASTEALIAKTKAETEKQQQIVKRETALASALGRQTSTQRLRNIQAEAQVRTERPRQQAKTMVGQPGVAATRVSTRAGIGGYGGTAPQRISPTGLNI